MPRRSGNIWREHLFSRPPEEVQLHSAHSSNKSSHIPLKITCMSKIDTLEWFMEFAYSNCKQTECKKTTSYIFSTLTGKN